MLAVLMRAPSCVSVLSHAEQLVLYLKSAELLSTALTTAMERVKQGKLYPSATVKQGTRPVPVSFRASPEGASCLKACFVCVQS